MPLLLSGLFTKRTPERSPSSSNRDSSDTEYVFPDSAVPPIYNLPAAASSTKLKLAFRRRPPNVASDSGHDLPPPPRIFSAHSSSVHSLPNDAPSRDTPIRTSTSDAPTDAPLKKSPGLFSWARQRTKSRPPQPCTLPSSEDHAESSFNLKSFRHVRADPPPPEQPQTDPLPPPPPPLRQRGDSVASDASQRISVAAFREAQARSRTNSPVPSFRPPSTADTLRVDVVGRKRASTISPISPVSPTLSQQPNKPCPPIPDSRPDRSVPVSSSESDSSDGDEDDEDEDVDSDGQPIPKPQRKRTITRRRDPRSDTTHSSSSNLSSDPPPSRQRASVSTSALTPNAAARHASTLAVPSSQSSHAQPKLPPKPDHDSDDSSNDSDCEDRPLSNLIPPRRPGSSASNYSNSRPRAPPKPLIDINTLAGAPPLLTPILRHEDSIKDFHSKGKEPDLEKDQPFSVPAVLALSSSPSPPISPSVTKQNVSSVTKPPSTVPDRRSASDVSAPPKSKNTDNDDDLINAIRLVGALDQSPQSPAMSDRIVPTPIREREPPTSFTVLSRPANRQSTVDALPHSRPSPLSPQPDSARQQRASTATNNSSQKDKSDTLSITSAARSTASRNSSRIPPVPLIHTIPDSPSLKEDAKGRAPSAPRTSALYPPQAARSQPAAPRLSNKVPSHGPPSLLPHRPFVSDISVRGESPAGSSTGDSSSGRSPFTPRDGSEIGIRSKDNISDVDSTLKARGHVKNSSVTFEDPPARGRERAKTDVTDEQRTRDRRRSEAKAALELGKIVNGRGRPGNDSDEDVRSRGRNPTINVTMENGGMMQPGWPGWQQPMATGMGPMVPPQFSNDPTYLAAHQRALLIAKQAYQMAVAQHAMQMAGEEWERGSTVGFGSGGSVYGGGSGGSVYGGGSGGSVYGGGGGGSVYGGMGSMGMMGMPNMGMLMPTNPWAARSSVLFPTATGSVYGGMSSSQSEYGGVSGWGSQGVYGDSFGQVRPVGNGAPNSSASAYGGGPRPRAWTGVASSSTPSSRPSGTSGKTPARGRAAPPSSWKSGR